MAVTVNEYRNLNNLAFGLGQDVSQDLKELVKVASIFVPNSKIHSWLVDERLKEVVTDLKIRQELITAISTNPITVTWKQLTGTRTKKEADSLVQAVFRGQGQRLAIVNWAAQNYVSVAVAFGLLNFHRATKSFTISELGLQAVKLYDSEKYTDLSDFLYQRLLEYPYAAWLLRLLGKDSNKQFSKFELGENFGFIDELGFSTAPVKSFLNGIAQAKIDQDSKLEKKIKSNFESTADKYMRWLAGVLVTSGLVSAETKKVSHTYMGRTFDITLGTVYQITYKGLIALNNVNGKSRYRRSKKRVMWEFLATKDKNAVAKKTTRSLILKHLVEKKNPLKAKEIANLINSDYPTLEVTPEEVIDDCKGLNRIGIEIDILKDKLTLKEKLYDFEIPIQQKKILEKTEIDKFKNELRSELDCLDHSYLKGIDIANKKQTTNAENTEFEAISTKIFTEELDFSGEHLGGSSKPDGLVWDNDCIFVLDSKAYSGGFTLTSNHTDPMGRYLRQINERNNTIKPTWWDISPSDLDTIYFAYISGSFAGNYENQLKKFRIDTGHNGAALEFVKLLLLANRYKANRMKRIDVIKSILDDHISYDEYAPMLIQTESTTKNT